MLALKTNFKVIQQMAKCSLQASWADWLV